jgi:hypothetical protein
MLPTTDGAAWLVVEGAWEQAASATTANTAGNSQPRAGSEKKDDVCMLGIFVLPWTAQRNVPVHAFAMEGLTVDWGGAPGSGIGTTLLPQNQRCMRVNPDEIH